MRNAKHQKNRHQLGQPDSKICIIEYLDFQCSKSASAASALKKALEAYEGEVSLIVRHFPMKEGHPWAELLAIATEAASNQGKFWEMHDLVFSHQEGLDAQRIFELAEHLELDMERFEKDIQSSECQEKLDSDLREAHKQGVNNTPTIFVNGHRLEGEVNFLSMSRAIAGWLISDAA